MKACFMGLGYIGLPTAIIAAKHGVEIAGVDINAQVVEVTNRGKLHIIEPGMEEMLREVLASGHFKAYTGRKSAAAARSRGDRRARAARVSFQGGS